MSEHPGLLDAIVRPPFGPRDSVDAQIDHHGTQDHLATCASCRRTIVAVRSDAAAIARLRLGEPSPWVRERILREAARADGRGALGALRLFAVAALLIAGLAGGIVGAGALINQRPTDPPTAVDLNAVLATKAVVWKAQGAILGADRVTVIANGQRIDAGAAPMKVGGDPGSKTYATLEVGWVSSALEQRITLSFTADETNWWISDARVYDNVRPKPDWVELDRPLGRFPLGTALQGDLDLTGLSRAGGETHLQISGAVIEMLPQASFRDPVVGGGPLMTDPFAPGGALECSGILQMTPVEADRQLEIRGIRRSWRFDTKIGSNTGFANAQIDPPTTGWISMTAIGSDGELILFVQNPKAPNAKPIALPAHCPLASGG